MENREIVIHDAVVCEEDPPQTILHVYADLVEDEVRAVVYSTKKIIIVKIVLYCMAVAVLIPVIAAIYLLLYSPKTNYKNDNSVTNSTMFSLSIHRIL
jgi:hypothetical protein